MERTNLTNYSTNQTAATQFSLFLKAHELEEITKVLKNVQLLPKKRRHVWLEENAAFINQSIENFVQESNITLSNLTLDDETLQLSKKLIISLRDTVDIMQDLLLERKKLTS